jgi:hypothetical protein
VSTFVLVPSLVAAFYALLLPAFQSRVLVISLGCAYGVLALLAVAFALVTSGTDPADGGVKAARSLPDKGEAGHQGTRPNPFGDAREHVFCYLCQTHVSRNSAHCRWVPDIWLSVHEEGGVGHGRGCTDEGVPFAKSLDAPMSPW